MLKKNDVLQLRTEDMTNLGFGVSRHEGLVIFTSGAVTGDLILTKIIKVNSSYAIGKIEKIIERSAHRVPPRCDVSACSGCAYKSVSYEHELLIKHGDVSSAFKKAKLDDVFVHPVTPSPCLLHYRNKAQYPVALNKNGKYLIGFYAPKSHRVTEARSCPLAPKEFPKILGFLAEFFEKHNISVYDENCGTGLIRHIFLRRGEVSGEIMLCLVLNGEKLPYEGELCREISERFSEVVSIIINTNEKNTNVILGDKFRTAFGRDYIEDELCGVRLRLTAPSFYQVNHGAAELLYKKARELAEPSVDDLLLDLYCGVGSIGFSMAESECELIGVEIVESAVTSANETAKRLGFSNAKFYTGDAADVDAMLRNAERELGRRIEPTKVILDPPRAGCDEKLINFVASLSPERIVYVSCNPQTLARDAAIFKSLGYSTKEVFPFDLFPGTGHVESVVCLKRQIQQ